MDFVFDNHSNIVQQEEEEEDNYDYSDQDQEYNDIVNNTNNTNDCNLYKDKQENLIDECENDMDVYNFQIQQNDESDSNNDDNIPLTNHQDDDEEEDELNSLSDYTLSTALNDDDEIIRIENDRSLNEDEEAIVETHIGPRMITRQMIQDNTIEMDQLVNTMRVYCVYQFSSFDQCPIIPLGFREPRDAHLFLHDLFECLSGRLVYETSLLASIVHRIHSEKLWTPINSELLSLRQKFNTIQLLYDNDDGNDDTKRLCLFMVWKHCHSPPPPPPPRPFHSHEQNEKEDDNESDANNIERLYRAMDQDTNKNGKSYYSSVFIDFYLQAIFYFGNDETMLTQIRTMALNHNIHQKRRFRVIRCRCRHQIIQKEIIHRSIAAAGLSSSDDDAVQSLIWFKQILAFYSKTMNTNTNTVFHSFSTIDMNASILSDLGIDVTKMDRMMKLLPTKCPVLFKSMTHFTKTMSVIIDRNGINDRNDGVLGIPNIVIPNEFYNVKHQYTLDMSLLTPMGTTTLETFKLFGLKKSRQPQTIQSMTQNFLRFLGFYYSVFEKSKEIQDVYVNIFDNPFSIFHHKYIKQIINRFIKFVSIRHHHHETQSTIILSNEQSRNNTIRTYLSSLSQTVQLYIHFLSGGQNDGHEVVSDHIAESVRNLVHLNSTFLKPKINNLKSSRGINDKDRAHFISFENLQKIRVLWMEEWLKKHPMNVYFNQLVERLKQFRLPQKHEVDNEHGWKRWLQEHVEKGIEIPYTPYNQHIQATFTKIILFLIFTTFGPPREGALLNLEWHHNLVLESILKSSNEGPVENPNSDENMEWIIDFASHQKQKEQEARQGMLYQKKVVQGKRHLDEQDEDDILNVSHSGTKTYKSYRAELKRYGNDRIVRIFGYHVLPWLNLYYIYRCLCSVNEPRPLLVNGAVLHYENPKHPIIVGTHVFCSVRSIHGQKPLRTQTALTYINEPIQFVASLGKDWFDQKNLSSLYTALLLVPNASTTTTTNRIKHPTTSTLRKIIETFSHSLKRLPEISNQALSSIKNVRGGPTNDIVSKEEGVVSSQFIDDIRNGIHAMEMHTKNTAESIYVAGEEERMFNMWKARFTFFKFSNLFQIHDLNIDLSNRWPLKKSILSLTMVNQFFSRYLSTMDKLLSVEEIDEKQDTNNKKTICTTSKGSNLSRLLRKKEINEEYTCNSNLPDQKKTTTYTPSKRSSSTKRIRKEIMMASSRPNVKETTKKRNVNVNPSSMTTDATKFMSYIAGKSMQKYILETHCILLVMIPGSNSNSNSNSDWEAKLFRVMEIITENAHDAHDVHDEEEDENAVSENNIHCRIPISLPQIWFDNTIWNHVCNQFTEIKIAEFKESTPSSQQRIWIQQHVKHFTSKQLTHEHSSLLRHIVHIFPPSAVMPHHPTSRNQHHNTSRVVSQRFLLQDMTNKISTDEEEIWNGNEMKNWMKERM